MTFDIKGMKYLLFIQMYRVYVVQCPNPSRFAIQHAALVCDRPTDITKDRFGLFTAEIYETNALDAFVIGIIK